MTVILDRLRSFVALAETLNFRRASEVVGRSQPAVSAQIKTLEDALGVVLMFRQTRWVQLSPEGELLYSRIIDVLAHLNEVIVDFEKIATLDSGQVRVGVSPTLAPTCCLR